MQVPHQFSVRSGPSEAALTAERSRSSAAMTAKPPNTTFIPVSARPVVSAAACFQAYLPALPAPPTGTTSTRSNHDFYRRNRVYITGVGSIDDFTINVPEEADEEAAGQFWSRFPVIRQRTNTTCASPGDTFSPAPRISRTVYHQLEYHQLLQRGSSRYRDNCEPTGRVQAAIRLRSAGTPCAPMPAGFWMILPFPSRHTVRWNLYRNHHLNENYRCRFQHRSGFHQLRCLPALLVAPRGTPWSLSRWSRRCHDSLPGKRAVDYVIAPGFRLRFARLDQDGRWCQRLRPNPCQKQGHRHLAGLPGCRQFVNRILSTSNRITSPWDGPSFGPAPSFP